MLFPHDFSQVFVDDFEHSFPVGAILLFFRRFRAEWVFSNPFCCEVRRFSQGL